MDLDWLKIGENIYDLIESQFVFIIVEIGSSTFITEFKFIYVNLSLYLYRVDSNGLKVNFWWTVT